jgi:hypothetical protein
VTVLRDQFHRIIDQLPEAELAPLLDYVRTHAHRAEAGEPVWDGPDFLGMFASGREENRMPTGTAGRYGRRHDRR